MGKAVRRRQRLQALGHVNAVPCEDWERVLQVLDGNGWEVLSVEAQHELHSSSRD